MMGNQLTRLSERGEDFKKLVKEKKEQKAYTIGA